MVRVDNPVSATLMVKTSSGQVYYISPRRVVTLPIDGADIVTSSTKLQISEIPAAKLPQDSNA